MSHTPGPWRVSTGGASIVRPDIEHPFYSVEGADGEPLGVYPFTEADARLIAAAPDLYEALERIEAHGREWDRSHLHEHECYEDIARAALDKVSGET